MPWVDPRFDDNLRTSEERARMKAKDKPHYGMYYHTEKGDKNIKFF